MDFDWLTNGVKAAILFLKFQKTTSGWIPIQSSSLQVKGWIPVQSSSENMSHTSCEFVLSLASGKCRYTVTYPANLSLSEAWMRSVNRDLRKHNISSAVRRDMFQRQSLDTGTTAEWNDNHFDHRFKAERLYISCERVMVQREQEKPKVIPADVAYRRVRDASTRSAKRMRSAQQEVNEAVAPLLCYGLLKTEGSYQQVRRMNNTLMKGKASYGITLPRHPTVQQVKTLADVIYNHPDVLTNSPDWVLRYRKGRLHKAGNVLALPNQKVTVTKIDAEQFKYIEDVEAAIIETLAKSCMTSTAMRIKKGEILQRPEIAAIVYFESAYHARCALHPLSTLGRVHLGQTIATARVVASKVQHTISMLLSEATGRLAGELSKNQLERVASVLGLRCLPIQIWIDKDGRVTFIKIKIVDVSYQVFEKGESRVAYLLEYIGDEAECRQFIPPLVDQFAKTNDMVFYLPNGVPVKVPLIFVSGDHKSLWAQTGRGGGNDHSDVFSHHSLRSFFHRVLYQGPVTFRYSEFIKIWSIINDEMKTLKSGFIAQNKFLSEKEEKKHREHLYRTHGRMDRVPVFMNGVHHEQPTVHERLLVVPLNLHNDTFDNLLTIDLMLHTVDPETKALKRIRARQKGLMDGFGQTKCSTSGEGIRRLIHECLPLEGCTIQSMRTKYSGIWWLKDTISYHLRITGHNRNYTPLALEEHERLKFATCTLLWWLLMGDLSEEQGGRTMKSGKTKNHLEDKVYPHETAHACVEFEERYRIPLSLVNEAIFEASFIYRDKLIEAFHSKVALERERKGVYFKQLVNVLAPIRRHRSIVSGMSRHIERNIIIMGCWKSLTKWSFNIRRMLLRRVSGLSYRGRVSLCSTGPHVHAILIKCKRTSLGTGFYDNLPPEPPLIVDPCGECTVQHLDHKLFDRSLAMWHFLWKIRGILARRTLHDSYLDRLRAVNIQRASRIREDLTNELKRMTPPPRRRQTNRKQPDSHNDEADSGYVCMYVCMYI